MIIYLVENKTNNMRYIGATKKTLDVRKSGHYSDAKHRDTKCRFHKALLKFDKKDFEWSIIETVEDRAYSERLEVFYIGYYDTYNNGYNETVGGKGMRGLKHKDISKHKMSETHKGMKCSDITKQRMSIAGKGRIFTEEHKQNLSKSGKSRKLSDGHKKKLSEAKKGKNNSRARAVIIDGRCFDTLKEASNFVGVNEGRIWRRINHSTKWSDYRYIEGDNLQETLEEV